jgi:hypothetical protein
VSGLPSIGATVIGTSEHSMLIKLILIDETGSDLFWRINTPRGETAIVRLELLTL